MSFSKVYSAQPLGIGARIIDVETDISKKTLHAFAIVGLPDKAVEESRDRVSAAIKNSGFTSPKAHNQKIVISLAPADLKKEGPLFDVAIAMSYLLAAGDISFEPSGKLFFGELSLDGTLRPIRGTLVLAVEAKKRGITDIFLPYENAREAAVIDGVRIFPARHLKEIISHLDTSPFSSSRLRGGLFLSLLPQEKTELSSFEKIADARVDFSDIKGQAAAKRGLLIAAAGGHNILLYGPPGTGKTMLARAFAGILPPLSFDEALEVSGIHSIAGTLREDILMVPPFRAPHHTASYVSLVGGGAIPRPGEITLAHRGVLFADEFPEFERRVIEALRQPLEDKVISVSRVKSSAVFPADFILVAAMNPCPCGNAGSSKKQCVCSGGDLVRYQRKISGPIMDRIDVWVQVGDVSYEDLAKQQDEKSETDLFREQVASARAIQRKRFMKEKISDNTGKKTRASFLNSAMSAHDISELVLAARVKQLLSASAERMQLSARGYHKVIKLARTIADLSGDESIDEKHILEALQYRQR
ncbi:MAG: YifB family Mg chelatase-like AAA ATPase [Parcubacteria group bacterium]|nr:YifB family Mg chelatase-like AAA ATPase [Parcubacteria group bacterium]